MRNIPSNITDIVNATPPEVLSDFGNLLSKTPLKILKAYATVG
jgi:hypothetical protein